MSDRRTIDMYELLPALYRLEDTKQGYPLRALLEVIAGQAGIIKRDIDGLWDDYFIETCNDWVIPYIGDLVANNPLYEVDQRRRPDVARTISYRRRKGTLPMLEELARNVTGWGAHAVAFFELLGWTQNLNHLRYEMASNPEGHPEAVDRVGTVNLRGLDVLDRLDGAFDVISHTVDVRPIRRIEGWYNIRKVGFFLWRLRHYALRGVTPRKATKFSNGYHFSPLGNPTPLFTEPLVETDETGLAGETHVPGPIRSMAFRFNPGMYYGRGRSLQVVADDVPVPLKDILYKDLSKWGRPPPGKVAVDVRLGRLAFAKDKEPGKLEVSYNYGFSADMGGGPYRRQRPKSESDGPDTLADPDAFGVSYRVPSTGVSTISGALEKWEQSGRPRAVIQLDDSRTYEESLSINMGDTELVIQADDRQRPMLMGDVTIPSGTDQARLVLNGLLIEGGVEVQSGLGELNIEHCTLVPGRRLNEKGEPREPDRPSLIVGPTNRRLRLEIDHSIVGPLRVPPDMVGLRVEDSIVDSPLRDGRAAVTPVLVSKSFPSRQLTLSSEEPAVEVTIGAVGPYKAVLPKEQSERTISLVRARNLLQEAIQAAHSSPAFKNARVITVPTDRKRLIVVPGTADTVTIEAAEGDYPPGSEMVPEERYLRPEDVSPDHAREVLGFLNTAGTAEQIAAAVEIPGELDVGVRIAQRILARRQQLGGFTDLEQVDAIPLIGPERFTEIVVTLSGARARATSLPSTAKELGLDRGSGRQAYALVSGPLPPSIRLDSDEPAVNIVIGDEGPYKAVLPKEQPERTISLVQARNLLQEAIRAAHRSPAFKHALVANRGNQLVVLPGVGGVVTTFGAAPDDQTTFKTLALESERPAIAASEGGELPGAPTTLERTTVLGAVHVRELTLASEVVFTAPVTSVRRQAGCVRFSYVPEHSLTPRRYRCQPDLAMAQRAQEIPLKPGDSLPPAERELVQFRLRPVFTSIHYGDPAYAQLGFGSAEELRTGAEDGSEMGAFCHLKQPQREANLRFRLEEYLPFGLEAGFIYVT
jgi:hypothetical protein